MEKRWRKEAIECEKREKDRSINKTKESKGKKIQEEAN